MKRKPALIFFTEYYYPAQNTTSYYLTDIIRTAAADWPGKVKIYTASSLEDKEEILTGENISIVRLSGGNLNKNSLVARLWKFFLITFKFFWLALWSISKGDTVFTVTNPAFMLICLSFLRKIRHFNYSLLVYDIFPEALIPAGLSKKSSFSYRLTLKIYNWAYRQVDHLIAIGRDMKEVVAGKTGRDHNITLIPNWVDVREIHPEGRESNVILKEYNLYGKRIFSLGGNMGRTQGLDNLLEAVSSFPGNEKIHFLLMGDGAWGGKIHDFIRQNPEIPVTYTGRIKQEWQSAMLNAGDIALISLAQGMYGISVPSKSYFNMAAGKPLLLIADENSEIALLIKEHDLGWVVPPGNSGELSKVIRQIQDLSDEELKDFALRSRTVAETYFAKEIILNRYREFFAKFHEKN